MPKKPNSPDFVVGIIGAGAMGRGIAQIMATGGLEVLLYDTNDEAAAAGRDFADRMIFRACEKGLMSEEEAKGAVEMLAVAGKLSDLAVADLVIEAVIEDLDVKRQVFLSLEECVTKDCVLVTNTSSLSVTAIAAVMKYPGRFAGFHFFNPVPLMKIVEVVNGLETNEETCEILVRISRRVGHEPVRAKDTPGFLVNHAGRGLNTEGVRIVSEGITNFSGVDDLLREGGPNFRMGPFELMDTTGLDVSHPVMESIYQQFYGEPRFRPNPLTLQRSVAGLHGRKTGRGFYTYKNNKKMQNLEEGAPEVMPESIWISKAEPEGYDVLLGALREVIEIDKGQKPSTRSLCLFTPTGSDVTSAATTEGVEAERSFGVDTLFGLDGRRTLMSTPVSDPDLRDLVHAALAADGHTVTVIHDSPGFVNQRVVATIVNIACDIAQQRIASPSDIDKAVTLGLGYPMGPLSMGDNVGAKRVLKILNAMCDFYGDPRYRASPWLKRRALLGVSLLTMEN